MLLRHGGAADGKIILAGLSNNGSNFDIALARYNTDRKLGREL